MNIAIMEVELAVWQPLNALLTEGFKVQVYERAKVLRDRWCGSKQPKRFE